MKKLTKKQLEKILTNVSSKIIIEMDYSAYCFQEHELSNIEKYNLLKLFKQFEDMFYITGQNSFNTPDCCYKII